MDKQTKSLMLPKKLRCLLFYAMHPKLFIRLRHTIILVYAMAKVGSMTLRHNLQELTEFKKIWLSGIFRGSIFTKGINQLSVFLSRLNLKNLHCKSHYLSWYLAFSTIWPPYALIIELKSCSTPNAENTVTS